jgi:predicted PurR-regulated permease PerM
MVVQLETFGKTVITYTRVRTISNLFVGVAFTILLLVLGVDLAFLWGFLAFVLSYIPTIGLPLAAIPAIILALLEQGFTTAIIVTVGVIIINFISDDIIAPRLSAQELEISPFVVFYSFVFWTWVFGPVGALLSVILTVAVKVVLEGYPETRGYGILMGTSASPEQSGPAEEAT